MITYVNSVFVSNTASSAFWYPTTKTTNDGDNAYPKAADKGKFAIMRVDGGDGITVDSTVKTPYIDAALAAQAKAIKIGLITGENAVKWSNVIYQDDVKSYKYTQYAADTEDTVYIDLSGATGLIGSGKDLSKKGKRIIVRLTFKDLPTRYRKWTESYEYITKDGDTAASIATGIAKMINGATKRARVIASVGEMNSTSASADATIGSKYFHADSNWDNNSASANNNTIKLVAMTYDDDDSVDSINWYAKVRFNANMYYTDPAAEGWASLNKNFITGAKIDKVPGVTSPNSWKLVRDREAQAMGYDGILNRGMGTWPIIAPKMNVLSTGTYDSITLEFENMYRAADDIFRKTKQTVELYGEDVSGVKAVLDVFTNILSTKLDVPAASSIIDGHKAAWNKTNGVVTIVDAGS